MKKLSLVLIILMIVGALFIPAVSAETIEGQIHDIPVSGDTISGDISDRSSTFLETPGGSGDLYYSSLTLRIKYDCQLKKLPSQIHVIYGAIVQTEEEYIATPNKYIVPAQIYANDVKYGDVNIELVKLLSYNPQGPYGRYTITFDFDWDYDSVFYSSDNIDSFYITGDDIPKIVFGKGTDIPKPATYLYVDPAYQKYGYLPFVSDPSGFISYQIDGAPFKQHYDISLDEYGMSIVITRIIDGLPNPSKIIVSNATTAVYDSGFASSDAEYNIPLINGTIDIISQATNKTYRIFNNLPTEPDNPPDNSIVTVYVKNSQTGALIADANIVIDALVDGEYYPVVNRTEPSGIFTINLQPTGGGKPNPDGYRLIVTADGYNNPMPEINFTVDDYKNYIHCLLDPIAGGPVNENKTFIDFFVRDMTSNPISGATVKFGKYTLITNSAGYTVFEVDKNNNYSWTISKSGYGALTGNAVIGDSPRHTINTVLAPIVTPTITTPIPTSPPIGPTPTMTAPSGEPVSNWLEWFAAHFGMILGGGVEIGKIFMWLCFTVPVGVYVGKEAKAGAAGFMAGTGIVTLFFVLIGWVPIWLVVLLALIIGLLYAKVFNTPDTGGGR